jgi:DNA-binding FrmR family transcriptional regulator
MQKLKQPDREAVAKRLKRAAGHLNATVAMLEAKRPCLDLAQQLFAVEAAIGNARQQVVSEQIQVCLSADAEGATFRQLKALARFL